jgi:hypothetical protein
VSYSSPSFSSSFGYCVNGVLVEEYLADDIRLQRLPDLPAAVLCAGTGACSGYCGYTQCVHHDGGADGYLRL